MAVGSHNVEVNGEIYTITTFTATKGVVYLKKIAKVIGPAFAELAGGSDENQQVEAAHLGKAAQLFFDNIDKEGVDKMIEEWVKGYVTKNGQPIIFDMEFAENYGALFALVKEIINLNYKTVFQGGFGGMLNNPLLKP